MQNVKDYTTYELNLNYTKTLNVNNYQNTVKILKYNY